MDEEVPGGAPAQDGTSESTSSGQPSLTGQPVPAATGSAFGGPGRPDHAAASPHGGGGDQPWLLPVGLPEDDAPERGRRASRIVGGAAAVVLAGALVAGGVLLAGDGSDDGATTSDGGSAAEPDETERVPPGGSDRGDDDGAGGNNDGPEGPAESEEFTEATVAGVVLPVPDGWAERSFAGAAVTADEYPCPGDADRTCVQAGAFLETADGDDAQAVAERDITEHLAESYADGTHDGIVEQREERAEKTAVADGEGYRVRYWVQTGAGTDAYAESVAFAAPDGSGRILVLRLGWADDPDAPSGGDMDDLVNSVRAAAPGGAGTEV